MLSFQKICALNPMKLGQVLEKHIGSVGVGSRDLMALAMQCNSNSNTNTMIKQANNNNKAFHYEPYFTKSYRQIRHGEKKKRVSKPRLMISCTLFFFFLCFLPSSDLCEELIRFRKNKHTHTRGWLAFLYIVEGMISFHIYIYICRPLQLHFMILIRVLLITNFPEILDENPWLYI